MLSSDNDRRSPLLTVHAFADSNTQRIDNDTQRAHNNLKGLMIMLNADNDYFYTNGGLLR